MKFASKVVIAILTFVVLTAGAIAQAQNDDPNRSPAPTIIGATGLFTVFDTTTLKRGEFNIGFFYNNFRRDPGQVHIENMPVNIALGFGKLELFANIDLNQTVTTRRPDALSGFLLPQNISPGQFSGFTPVGNGSTPFFTFNGLPFVTGAIAGGILPGIANGPNGTFPILVNNVNGLDLRIPGTNTVRPGFGPFCNPTLDPGCTARGVVPVPPFLFFQDVLGFQGLDPSYLNDYPFIGRGSGNGLGNITTGAKYRLNSEDSRISVAVLGMVRIPTITADNLFTSSGLLRGRGAGATDVGGFVIFDAHIRNATISANFGYMHDGNPKINGVQILDRADEFHSRVGLNLALKKHFQFVTELTDEAYVGSRTPNLNQINPLEYRVGVRFFPRSWIQFGGSYQILLNGTNDLDNLQKPFVNVNSTAQVLFVQRTLLSTDPDGFVGYISFGR